MRDIVLEETVFFDFTTRAFATGIPTVLAGTPVLSVLEENNATPITAGVSVSVDRASVVGLNMATIVATAANGYEVGKGYSVYISTGTVGGVSVVGEVVAQFTIDASSATQDLANGTDGLTALKTGIDAIPTTAMRGTDSAALATVCTETRLAELDAGNLPTDIAAIPTTAMRGTDGANTVVPDAAGTAPTLAEILESQLTEAYAADGVAPTLTQAIFLIQQSLTEFAIAGTSNTVKRLNGSTTAAVMTLDDATDPTSSTRTS